MLIGLGDVVARFVIEAAKKLGIEIVAVADMLSKSGAERRLKELGIGGAKYFKIKEDYNLPQEFLEAGDMVYIGSPHNPKDTHPIYAQQAAKHDKPIILEKPAHARPQGGKEIEEAFKKIKIVCANHHTFYPAFLYLIRLLRGGELRLLGRIVSVEGEVFETDRLTHPRNIWLFRGPGIGVDTLPHLLVKLFTLGAEGVEVNKVYWDSIFDKGAEVKIGGQSLPAGQFINDVSSEPSEVFMSIELKVNGENFIPEASARFSAGKLMPMDSRKFIVNFERGEAVFADHHSLEIRGEGGSLTELTAKGNPYINILINALKYFETGIDHFNTLKNALQSMKVIHEAYTRMERARIYDAFGVKL